MIDEYEQGDWIKVEFDIDVIDKGISGEEETMQLELSIENEDNDFRKNISNFYQLFISVWLTISIKNDILVGPPIRKFFANGTFVLPV